MGLMRHLTRSKRPETSTRSPSTEGRPQISLPIELISTTNMLSYSAPSVASMRAVSSSTVSSRVSQHSTGDDSTITFEPCLTDASSLTTISSPGSPIEPTRTGYFSGKESKEATVTEISAPESPISDRGSYTTSDYPTAHTPAFESDDPFTTTTTTTTTFAPALPSRAPSHSKREHVRLARRRSERMSLRLVSKTQDPTDDLLPRPAPLFSSELEQLNEAVEELSGMDSTDNTTATFVDITNDDKEDVKVMKQLGLQKWTASQYLLEIQGHENWNV